MTCFKNMFATQTVLVRSLRVTRRAPKDFTGNKPGVARPTDLAENFSHYQFGTSRSISLRIVEKIDASVVSFNHQGLSYIVRNLVTEGDPGPERKFANLNPGFTKSAVFHIRCYACTYLRL